MLRLFLRSQNDSIAFSTLSEEQYEVSADDMRVLGNWLIVHGVDENELKQGKHKLLKTTAISHARYLIRRYGTDGYGDKPPTMNVFEQWCVNDNMCEYKKTFIELLIVD
eukprot:7942-Heterococcus_DN1.PRE.4